MPRELIDRTGEINYNKFGSKMKIIRYCNTRDVDIYFEEYNWTKYNTQYKNFKYGTIKCPYEKRTEGVGYLGEGKYKPHENGKDTSCYKRWTNMLGRCYNLKNPSYLAYGGEGVKVNDDFLCFQNYAEWYYGNYYEIEGEEMEIDKDILVKGNKIYSPETCIFVPQRINTLFTTSKRIRGDFPIGVRKLSNGKFQSCYHDGSGIQKHLGVYETPEEAFQVYKEFKENLIKQVADEYKDKIPQKLYDAMYNYKVEITD